MSIVYLPAKILYGAEYETGYWSKFNPKGAKEKKWAEEVKFDTPVEVSVTNDGSILFSDGHHRAMAGRILGISIPTVIVRNELDPTTWKKVLKLIEHGYSKRDFNPEGYNISRNPDIVPTVETIKEAKARGLFADRLNGDLTEFYRQSNSQSGAKISSTLLKAAMILDGAVDGCAIVSISETAGDVDMPGGRDFYDVIEDVERLFKTEGIRISSQEEFYEACLDTAGDIMGATVVAVMNSGEEPHVSFSVAVSSLARRKGIAKRLVSSIVETFGDEYPIEAHVINPAMVPLLSGLGFDEPHRGWSRDNPIMRRNA